MPRGRPKKVDSKQELKSYAENREKERIEAGRTIEEESALDAEIDSQIKAESELSLEQQIISWLTRKKGFESLSEEHKKFIKDKARKMVKAGYVMENGVPVQRARV
jgi:hypothetical protein